MAIVDNVIKHLLDKLTKDPIKVELSDYGYSLVIFAKEQAKKKVIRKDNYGPKK